MILSGIEKQDDKKIIVDLLKMKNQINKDLSSLMRDIIKNQIEKLKDIEKINKFFSELYDELYYDIIFKNIKIDKKTFRLLEGLAIPLDKKSDKEWGKMIDKIKKS